MAQATLKEVTVKIRKAISCIEEADLLSDLDILDMPIERLQKKLLAIRDTLVTWYAYSLISGSKHDRPFLLEILRILKRRE